MKKYLLFILFTGLLFLSCQDSTRRSNDSGQNKADISTRVLTQNLNYPWEILWGPDNMIWMTERGGKISKVDPATGVVKVLLIEPEVESNGEGGMLGMALHPEFSANPYVFVAFDYDQSGTYKGKVVRYTYNGFTLINPVRIMDNIEAAGIHNGCRLLITPDLKLFLSTGDASNQSLSQNNSSLNGKILRLNLDGTIPTDNPVTGNPLWTKGNRNAQGLVFANNILYSSEHGPDSDDEVNIIEKGRNYGWPDVKGFCDKGSEQAFCKANNVKEPIKTWTPTAALSGMDYYNDTLIPEWKNSLLVVALKNSRLYQLKLNDAHTAITGTNEFLNGAYGRMRDVCISPDGKVYICTSNGGNDKIIEVK